MTESTLIGFFGMPGSGKSSLARALATRLSAINLIEPEESEWPAAVKERDTCGHATALHWFRSIRVPMLYAAASSKLDGKRVVTDALYDKLCGLYLGRPGMEWLISPQDPYFNNILDLAKLDLHHLPDPDILVCTRVTENDWLKMLQTRNRNLDNVVSLKDTFATQEHFLHAATQYASMRGESLELLLFDNVFSTVNESCDKLVAHFKNVGLQNSL